MKTIQECSNCGKESVYERREYVGRETTLCKSCNKPLSVCSGAIFGMMDEKQLNEFAKICKNG